MAWHRRPDPDLALRQWESLTALLQGAGAKVELLPHNPRSTMQTFTADGALIFGPGQALLLPNDGPRGDDEPRAFRTWLEAAGFLVEGLPPGCRVDGGNIIPAGPDLWLAGLKPGVNGQAERYIGKLLRRLTGGALYGVPLADRRYLHLDMALCALGGRAWLLYPGAFADGGASLRAQPWFGGRPVLEVSDQDGAAFACNAVVVGKTVVTGLISKPLHAAMAELGLQVECLDLGQFYLAGGGAKCLTLPLEPPTWTTREERSHAQGE